MKHFRQVVRRTEFLALLLINFAGFARAELYINEIFFDPGGSGSDTRDEYIELRGTPNMPLTNHYLIFIENEDDDVGLGEAGQIDNIFHLGSYSMGNNGFLTIRQKNTRHGAPAPGTTDLVNTSTGTNSIGYGSLPDSTIGAEDSPFGDVFPEYGRIENGGFTAMLIRADPWGPNQQNPPVVPFVPTEASPAAFDLDVGNDGLDPAGSSFMNWRESWTILDSIGLHETDETEFGRLYAQVNFGVRPGFLPPDWEPKIEEGAEFVMLNYEIEYVGRWGNSTGQTSDDWHVSNFTDNAASGFQGHPDWRQSCLDLPGCHPVNDNDPTTPAPQPPGGTESNKGVPYGTKMTDTLGGPNYLTGDFNGDGYVDAGDYIVWRHMVGQTGFDESNHPAADANHDFVIDEADYDAWLAHFGEPNGLASGAGSSLGIGQTAVPEPASVFLAAFALFGLLWRRSWR